MEILIGLLIGFAIGTTGVGGGTLTAPALILILGFTPRTSVATALIFSATVKLSAVAIYAWKSQVKYRVLTYLLLGGVSGAVVGSLVIEHFRSGRSEAWALLIVGLTITASAIAGLVVRPKVHRNAEHKTSFSPAAVVGTDLSFGLITSASGGIVHAFAGGCNWTVLANLVPAGMVGTFAGAMVSHRLPSRALRVAILVCAALVGVLLCVRSVRQL